MSHFIVTPFIKKDNKFALFTVNAFFGIKENKTFNSVEEAKDFPLVQQMFYLPFVKSVELMDNGLALERFDILDWKDVIDEVGQEIQKYLNDGGKVTAESDLKKIPVTVYAESTPNPSVMKFVANKMLVDAVYEFKSIEEASTAPIAASTLSISFCKGNFYRHKLYFDQ